MPKITEIDPTPNPNAYRFTLKERLSSGIPRSFSSKESAKADELVAKLFVIVGVIDVYYVDNWITVTQDGTREWPELLQELAIPIREAPAIMSIEEEFAPNADEDEEIIGSDDERYPLIFSVINERVRPALIGDGGDIKIVSLIGNNLTFKYFGACGSCPSAFSGTLNAIENLMHSIDPELNVAVV